MAHDFKRFPELTNSQMDEFYFQSPHKQIVEDFQARVVKVTDGDTIRVTTDFRDFDFPIRFLDTAAPELKERGGRKAQRWLAEQILGEMVTIEMTRGLRVGKWGRLLGEIIHQGMNINQMSMDAGHAIPFEDRRTQSIPSIEVMLG